MIKLYRYKTNKPVKKFIVLIVGFGLSGGGKSIVLLRVEWMKRKGEREKIGTE